MFNQIVSTEAIENCIRAPSKRGRYWELQTISKEQKVSHFRIFCGGRSFWWGYRVHQPPLWDCSSMVRASHWTCVKVWKLDFQNNLSLLLQNTCRDCWQRPAGLVNQYLPFNNNKTTNNKLVRHLEWSHRTGLNMRNFLYDINVLIRIWDIEHCY